MESQHPPNRLHNYFDSKTKQNTNLPSERGNPGVGASTPGLALQFVCRRLPLGTILVSAFLPCLFFHPYPIAYRLVVLAQPSCSGAIDSSPATLINAEYAAELEKPIIPVALEQATNGPSSSLKGSSIATILKSAIRCTGISPWQRSLTVWSTSQDLEERSESQA